MMEACFKGNLDLVRLFLSYDCDANEKYGDDQYTPLMLAALGGHAEIMVSLLEAGADPNAQNRIGKTAAMLCFLQDFHLDRFHFDFKFQHFIPFQPYLLIYPHF